MPTVKSPNFEPATSRRRRPRATWLLVLRTTSKTDLHGAVSEAQDLAKQASRRRVCPPER